MLLLRIIIVIVHVGIIIVVVHVGAMKTCVVIVEAQKKGKTKNETRMEALKKNESWLKFAIINL
jgi:hypothetical protein